MAILDIFLGRASKKHLMFISSPIPHPHRHPHQVMLVKQLCGAYKAEVKLDEKAAAAREEKKKDLEVVRSARSTFDEQKKI